MPKSIKEKTPSAHLAKDPAKSAKNLTQQRQGLHREELEQREQSGSVLPRRIEETQALGSQSDETAVPKRSEDTRRRDRRNKPHKSPSLSSDAESEDFSEAEDERSQRQGRHRHKKHHSHQKTSSRHTSFMSSAAHRSRNDKKRPSPPHVVLKLRRVASSPHPTTKGAASTRRHSKEYVIIHGNRAKTQKIGHGDTHTSTGRLKRQSATLDSDESCSEVHKDNRRRISYEQYRANTKRSDSHKSKVVARATFVPSAAAHISKVSVETQKSSTSDRRMLKTRPLSQSEEQRLAEVTARIRARQRALCPLTAEWSLKKKALSKSRPTSSQHVAAQSTGASSVGAEGKATALRHGTDVITFKPKSPRSRKGMTLAEFVKLAKEKGGKGRLLEKLAAQHALEKAAALAANVGENGARYTEPFGPLMTTAELGQKTSALTRRPDGRHQHNLGQPELPPSGQKSIAQVRSGHDGIWSGRDEGFWHQPQYRIESALFPGSQQVSQSVQSAATAVTASSHDVTQTDSQSEPPTSRPTPLEVLQRVRAKHKVDPKDSTGGEAAKGPSSLLSCDPEPEARRHGNANGIKLADIHEQQATSKPKPVTSQRKPLRSPPTPLRSPPTPLASPHTSLTSQLTPPQLEASNNNNNNNDDDNDQPQVAGGDSPAGEPAKRQHSVWSSDSESESESDDECWCMECFKSRIMGWAVPHEDKFALMKQASFTENQTAIAVPTAEAQDSAETAVMTSALSEIPTPDESNTDTMATMESAIPGTASVITEGPVSTTYTTETASAERRDHDSTGTAISAHLATLGKAILSDSTATATLTQPMTPWTQEDRIPLEEALAIFDVTAEGEDNPNTAEEASIKCKKTPTHESSEVNKKIVESSSPQSQEEWFRVFLDEAFGDFRPVSPTGSLHSSLFGSSKSEFSQEGTGSAGSKKVRSSSESTRGSASSAQSSNDTGHSNGKMAVSKKQVQSSSDTSSSKGGRGNTSSTTSSGPLPSNKSRRRGKRTGSKKRVQSSSDTSSDKTGRDYSTSSTTTSSSALSSSDKSSRGGKRSRARISSDTSSGKRSRTSTSTSTSSNPLTRNDKNSRRGGRRAGSKRARSSSDTSSGKRSRTRISARTFVNHLASDNKKSRRGGRGTCSKTKKPARSSSDTSSGRGNTSISTPCLLPSKTTRTQTSPVYNSYKTTRTKPSCQNKLISMYYSCEPINFFAPDEKRDDGDDGYETPWNFGVTPNLSLRRSEGGLWHSCRPVRSLSRPPPLPPPLYRPRPPWLEHVEDSPPPTSPGSPRHPDYPLRYGATGRSQPARYYMAPYHRVGVLEHVGSPLQSTSTCPDHMVARYQNYLWIEPYDWSGTNMCDMFDVTELR